MTPHTARDLHRRTLAAVRGERTPWEGASSVRVAVDRYLDGPRLDRERALMRRHPQPVASSAELAQPGSWLARDRCGMPILVVRLADGAAQAFLNVCRHRGARVCDGAGQGAQMFRCPYHGWTYGLDGSLRGLPHPEGFPDLERGDSGLRRLPTRERAGLVWVVPDPAQRPAAIDAALGPLMDELEAMLGRSPVPFAPQTHIVTANWKLIVDGTFEAYHFKIAHRSTIAPMFADNLQIADEFGLHRRLYLVKESFAAAAPPDLATFDPRQHGNLIYFFFPNVLFLVQPDHAQAIVLEPTAVGATTLHEVALLPEAPATEKARRHWDANIELFRNTLGEDYRLAESIQSGLASGANEFLRFGAFEYAAPRLHLQLERLLDDTPNAF